MAGSNNGFDQWKNYIIKELERLLVIEDKVDLLNIEIAKLKVKSGIWGILGGSVPVVLALTIYLIKTLIG